MKINFYLILLVFGTTSCFDLSAEDGRLVCGPNMMKISLNVDKFNQHNRPYRAYFEGYDKHPICSVKHGNTGDPLELNSKFNECGVQLIQHQGQIIYTQIVLVTYGYNPKSSLVYREEAIRFKVECVLQTDLSVGLADPGYLNVSKAEVDGLKEEIRADAEFDIKLVRTTDGSFSSEDSSSQMRLGDQMYFKLELNTIRDDLKISPQTCYASSTKDSSERYLLIEDGGCPNMADGTIRIPYENDQKLFKWENEAFRFFGDSDAVYITCNVNVCNSNDYGDDCLRCNSIKRRRRRRRAVFHFNEEKINTKQQRVIVSTQVYKLI